jgi:hypothetical protein
MPARVHKVTHRHHEEVGLNLYARRLDKIYTKLGKAPMLPKVIKKMRDEYHLNPHDFYVKVCLKYDITPDEKIDAYRLVYGRTEFEDYKFERNKREKVETESKKLVREVKEEEPSTSEEEEEEEEDEPEPPRMESKFKFDMPDRNELRTSPRYERSSPRFNNSSGYRSSSFRNEGSFPRTFSNNERSSPRISIRYQRSSPRVNVGSSPRGEVLGSPRVGSPRAFYRVKDRPVKQLDYVNVVPGNIIETMVLMGKSGKESGFWIPARILSINEEKEVMDLQVLHPIKYGLPSKAIEVPYRYVRKPDNIVWDTMPLV